MNDRQRLARNFDEYFMYNHTSVYYTYKMEYEVINDIKRKKKINVLNVKTTDELITYLEELVINNFFRELVGNIKMERNYDFYNQNNITESSANYLKTRNGKDFDTAIVKNVYNKYGNNFLFHVDNYYKDDDTWKTVMLDFFNDFINNFLKNSDYLYNYNVSAVFYTIDSTDGISVMVSEAPYMNEDYENRKYKYFEKLNNDHKDRVDRINELKGFN